MPYQLSPKDTFITEAIFIKYWYFFAGRVPPFNEYLNVNTPLQIGGLMAQQFDPLKYRWSHTPMGKPFEGCIKNIIHNSKLYDLAEPGLQLASKPGCLQLEDVCKTSFPGKKFRKFSVETYKTISIWFKDFRLNTRWN